MIVSRQNAKLKSIRRLRKSKGDKALLEGPRLVAEALTAGVALESVFLSPELAERADGKRIVERATCEVEIVEPAVLASLMDADTPQGALAVASLPRRGVIATTSAPTTAATPPPA